MPAPIQSGGLQMEGLPLVDVGALAASDPAEWAGVAQEIDLALRQWGFLYIVNHGVSEAQMAEAFGLARALFALPLERKPLSTCFR